MLHTWWVIASVLAVVALSHDDVNPAVIVVVANCTAEPLHALSNARDRLRGMKPLNVSVHVHVLGTCSEPLLLDPALDSGTSAEQRVVYTTLTDGAISGGVSVPWSAFSKMSCRRQQEESSSSLMIPSCREDDATSAAVYYVNLTERFGLTTADFGSFANGGLGQCGHTLMQLYMDDIPMIVARTPNAHELDPPNVSQVPWKDWLFPTAVSSAVPTNFYTAATANASSASQSTLKPIAAAFADGRSVTANSNVWAHGYWSWDWADNYVRVLNVSAVNNASGEYLVEIDPSTPPVYGVKAGNNAGRFYLVNHPVFLDAPGEYYMDTEGGVLYFVPPLSVDDMQGRILSLSLQASPLITTVNVTAASPPLSHITIAGIAIRYGRTVAVSIDTAVDVVFSAVSVLGLTQDGINVGNGLNVSVRDSSMSQLGCSGISLSGGNTRWLTASYNTVSDNLMHGYGRLTRSYSRGVYVGGVAAVVTNNTIYNAPHQGISASGNNHTFDSNTLQHLCYGTIDAGAFYIGRSWINRGMSLVQNSFSHIRIREPVTHTGTMVSAIYWDDQQSGCYASGNVMQDVDNCFLVGGGRDNTVVNNTCIDSHNFMIYMDNRGMNWQKTMCTAPSGELVQQLYSVNYTSAPYAIAYPRIVTTLSDRPCVPVGNYFASNVFQSVGLGFMSVTVATLEEWGSVAINNTQVS